jgi:hypothetical protein
MLSLGLEVVLQGWGLCAGTMLTRRLDVGQIGFGKVPSQEMESTVPFECS